MTFLRLLSVLKDDILLPQPIDISVHKPPLLLPPTIATFVSKATGIDSESISACWSLLKEEVWSLPRPELSMAEEGLFRDNGWKMGLTSLTLYPPSHECQNRHCTRATPLKKEEPRQTVVYTLGHGALPAWAVHIYCPDCNTNYHHNYSVQAGIRTYYGDTPNYIQIGEHQFAERKLIAMWMSLMLLAWVSATNCAKMYDMALSEQQQCDFADGGWQFGCVLTTDHVWDAFVTLTLLNYHNRKDTCLQVPHTGAQRDRFTAAMRARNCEVIEEGQDEIGHCCDRCMRTLTRPDGTEYDVQIIVGDGLNMGHYRCQATHCTRELSNNRHKFCPEHQSQAGICAIVGCEAPVIPEKLTCVDPQHAEMEHLHFECGRAAFTLCDRLHKHRLAHPSAPAENPVDDEGDDDDVRRNGRGFGMLA
ncbi:hypothetical protein DFH07DRAFT_738454 [Mycena maculata]|uniref:CxC5 like cysteine cluster associated with KDZ domain-containing protein n=1 Tax=Mycena maculata TaxID=230809 RepID=A0AAD7JIS5_9AGAR|nr:hypothetical protein DFH07DRAFT_738454 [Mycena maculata]